MAKIDYFCPSTSSRGSCGVPIVVEPGSTMDLAPRLGVLVPSSSGNTDTGKVTNPGSHWVGPLTTDQLVKTAKSGKTVYWETSQLDKYSQNGRPVNWLKQVKWKTVRKNIGSGIERSSLQQDRIPGGCTRIRLSGNRTR